LDPTAYKSNYNYTAPQSAGDIKGFNPDYTATFGTQNKNSQNFYGGQAGQIGAFQGAYQAATNALPTYQKLYSDAAQEYNVAPLATNAANLQNTLLQVPQTYSQATVGSDTNNNQLMQLIGQKQWELGPIAQAATNSAQTAQGLAATKAGYGIQNENFLTQPYQTAAPMITSEMASAASGFNQEQANELQALEQKLASGVTLTTTEMNNLNQLKIAEEGYQNALAVGNQTGQYALKNTQLGNQNYVLNPYQSVYNTVSGQSHTAGV
jgi:hypothetical protein